MVKETEFIGSLDAGTTSCRFMIFDRFANVIAQHQIPFKQIYPHPGWHEHDPTTHISASNECIAKAVEEFEGLGYKRNQIKAVGITNQRETTVVWDKDTGKPIANAIAWPDTRNQKIVEEDLSTRAKSFSYKFPDGELRGEEAIKKITGLPFSTYFVASKYAWLLKHSKEVQEAKAAGKLRLGTVDTWILYNLTGGINGGVFATDVTNASRTHLLSLHTTEWDPKLTEFYDIPLESLAKITSNAEVYGKFHAGHTLEGIPIASLIGDQQSALVGNKCFIKGEAKQTYGTGCFMLFNTGTEIVPSTHGLLTTVAYRAGPNATTNFALEGSVAVAGSSMEWLRDNLGLIKKSSEVGDLALSVKDTGGVYFVTGFSGLFAPYWDMRATGMIIGISSFTTKAHIARATLEAICFQTRAILEAMEKDTVGNSDKKSAIVALKVDGGMSASDALLSIQADILGLSITRPEMNETTALGAALLAGAAVGAFGWDFEKPETFKDVNNFSVKKFNPSIDEKERRLRYAQWNRAIERSKAWKEEYTEDA